jgi:hypothetical protein
MRHCTAARRIKQLSKRADGKEQMGSGRYLSPFRFGSTHKPNRRPEKRK